MESARWRQVNDVFQAALEEAPSDRPAFVDRACAGDAALREEVESLLAAHDRADSPLDVPALERGSSLFGHGTDETSAGLTRPGELSLAAGPRLGPYQIVSGIGAGGMGVVYRARDTRLDRTVAIKMLPLHIAADPDLQKRFEREARTISSLNHPHICALYDVGQQEGVSFLVMEYLEGETLVDRLARGPLPLDEAVRRASEVAEALGEAHRHGIVHRDLKPANVVLTRTGAKLLDFGIAKLRPAVAEEGDATFTGSPALTGEGQIIGTVRYMSPEQLEGREVDARTDVFALGLLFYEMLTGRKAFEASSRASLIAAVLERVPPPPSRFQPLAPPSLDALVKRCLAKRPQDRWQSCADLVAQLTAPLAPPAEPRAAAGGRGAGPRSLAVLPFTWVGEAEDDYLGFGLADALITRMGNIREIVVRPTSAVRRYMEAARDPIAAGRALDVEAVLDGCIQRSGEKLRVTVQLIDVRAGAPLWGERFDEKLSDIFELQDSISERVIASLPLKLSTEERNRLARRHTEDPEALKAYLRGRFHWFKRTEDGMRRGIEYFQLAIERDPAYALPYAGLADCYMLLGSFFGTLPLREAVERATAGAKRALALDEGLGEAHATLGLAAVLGWRWAEADPHFRQASELSPNYAATHNWRAVYLGALGRSDEAVHEARAAVQAEPLSAIWSTGVGHLLYMGRHHQEAIVELLKTLELDERFFLAHCYLGLAYAEVGRIDEAVRALEQADALSAGSPLVRALLGRMYALSGRKDDARRVLDDMEAMARKRSVPFDAIALVYSALGEVDRAFDWLRRGCDERAFWVVYYLGPAPVYDELRADPRFTDILRRVGLPAA